MSNIDRQPHAPPPERSGTIVPEGLQAPMPVDSAGLLGGVSDPYGPVPGMPARPLVLALLGRYKWTVLGVFVLVAAPVLAAIWAMVVPQYRATAQVRVRPIIPRLVFKTEDNGLIPLYQSYLNTQVAVIRSPTVLQRVLDRPEVQRTAWYSRPREALAVGGGASPMERLAGDLVVRPRGRTEVIDIALAAPDAHDAAVIVNAVLDEYIRFVNERSEQTDDRLFQTLAEQHSALRNRIKGLRQTAAQIRKELGTSDPAQLISQRRLRIEQLRAQLEDLGRQISLVEWQQKQLERTKKQDAQQAGGHAEEPGASSRYALDPEWRRLQIEFKTARTRLEIEKARLGEVHPTMVALRKRADLAAELLREREAQLDRQWAAARSGASGERTEGALLAGFGSPAEQVELLKYKEKLLREAIAKEELEFARDFDKVRLLEEESEAIRHTQELYSAVRARLDQKEMERNVPGSIEVLARAFAPSAPYRDRRVLLSAMILCVALAGGLGVAYLRATTSQAIQEAGDLAQTVRAPFLGQLPLVREHRDLAPERCPGLGESIRMVRTALLQRISGQQGSAVQITSAGAGAGKTTVAVLLAKSLAQCGKKVLLVDTDLRNPTVSERFGIDPSPGILGSLTAQAADLQAIIETDTVRLSVLPAGNVTSETDPELLANGAFSTCLERWRRKFDIILLDSPPILPVADARILSRMVDGTIMVVREGHCRRAEVVDALAYLGTSGGKLLGTVFIGASRRGSYGYAYYGQTYPVGGSSRVPRSSEL